MTAGDGRFKSKSSLVAKINSQLIVFHSKFNTLGTYIIDHSRQKQPDIFGEIFHPKEYLGKYLKEKCSSDHH